MDGSSVTPVDDDDSLPRMPAEIVALIAKPYSLIAVLAVGAVIGIVFERIGAELRRQNWRQRKRRRWQSQAPRGVAAPAPWQPSLRSASHRQPDAADQLRIVMNAEFSIQPLLNRGESRVFQQLDRMVLACNPRWQVMAQVSVGEILRSRDPEAYRCINSKRVDLLLVDADCRPKHAIEYQGEGHHQGTAAARDAVKREALRRAGIGYHEVVAGHTTPSELRRLVEKLVDRPVASPSPTQS